MRALSTENWIYHKLTKPVVLKLWYTVCTPGGALSAHWWYMR